MVEFDVGICQTDIAAVIFRGVNCRCVVGATGDGRIDSFGMDQRIGGGEFGVVEFVCVGGGGVYVFCDVDGGADFGGIDWQWDGEGSGVGVIVGGTGVVIAEYVSDPVGDGDEKDGGIRGAGGGDGDDQRNDLRVFFCIGDDG